MCPTNTTIFWVFSYVQRSLHSERIAFKNSITCSENAEDVFFSSLVLQFKSVLRNVMAFSERQSWEEVNISRYQAFPSNLIYITSLGPYADPLTDVKRNLGLTRSSTCVK